MTTSTASPQRPPTTRTYRKAPPGRRLLTGVPTAMALATVALGVVDIVSALTPERAARLRELTSVVPLPVAHAASAGTAVIGVVLVMLGHGLRRRKQRAWQTVTLLVALSTALHLVKGLDGEEASGSLVVLVALLVLRKQFFAAGDPRTRLRAPLVFVAMVLLSFGLGMALLAFQGHHLAGSPSVGDRLLEVVEGLFGVAGPLTFVDEQASDLASDVLLALGAATVLVPAYLALRAPEPPGVLVPDDECRLRALLARHGRRDSLGYFTLRRDKSVLFSPSGKAAISYRVVSGVMLASGDPVGDPEAWPAAIAVFVDESRKHGWIPAVVGCSEVAGEVWVREAGLRALELGDEAVIEVADFTLDGRPMRNVRQMTNRVERAGYTTRMCRVADMTPEEIADIRHQAAAWRGAEVERGFSMALGRFGDPDDGECVAVTAHKDGRLAAVLHFVPWGPDGLSLELMRRDRAADAGLNELLIVAAMRGAPEMGVTRVSLNFAVFRSALERGGRLGAGPVMRAWRHLLLIASRWFQIESLYRFNAKFRPIWEPRFICYPAARDLPRVALAAVEAEAFLVWPSKYVALRRARRRSGAVAITS